MKLSKSPQSPEKICILGGGSWGATLATLLSQKEFSVSVWEFDKEKTQLMKESRTLPVLPMLRIPENVLITSDIQEALNKRTTVVLAVPSHFARSTLQSVMKSKAWSENTTIISVVKGIENESLKSMSQVILEEVPQARGNIAVLSGPSHAEEVCRKIPTAVVAAAPNITLAQKVQTLFSTNYFRIYSHDDLLGVELAGSLKNIYAIATGICDGLGLGDNTKAALMTRGLHEMAKLGVKQGGKLITFFGLSGMGDLIVTCTSRHSRNRSFGEKIGSGKSFKQALSEMTMVAEGVKTTLSAKGLANRHQMELPLAQEIYACLYEDKPSRECVQDLMNRKNKPEWEEMEKMLQNTTVS